MAADETIESNIRGQILITEDEPRLLYSITFILKRQGYSVTPAMDAESAIANLENNENFNLVISDIQLPGINGLEFIDLVRNKGLSIPFLIITAYKSKDISEGLKKRNIKFILYKPFDKAELIQEVANAMAQIDI